MSNQCDNKINNTTNTVPVPECFLISTSVPLQAAHPSPAPQSHLPSLAPKPSPSSEFSQDTSATRQNFPSATQFKQLCALHNFNRVLDLVKSKMFAANISFLTVARIMNHDFASFPSDIVKDVKEFLVTQGFTITDIEDAAGISQGWKLTW
jgi:hypothetical protein